ncbi:MAG: DUF4184 family protein [Candidatus Diapherotrites archaeon]
MVFTPLHAGFVIPLWLRFRRLDLTALLVGCMLPDFEIPLIWILTAGATDRIVLHSLFGGLLLGVPIALIVSFYLVPFTIKFLPRNIPGLNLSLFARRPGMPLKISAFSALMGLWSHSLIDTLMYHGTTANPTLWPFASEGVALLLIPSDPALTAWIWAGIACILLLLSARALARISADVRE